jgi:ketosteroid isomerase-like protein
MKGNRRWSVLLTLFLLLSLINSRSFATSSEDEARTMDNRRHQAILAPDIAALETLLADDLIFIHSNGTVDNQGQFLAPLKSEDLRVKNTGREDVRVRVFGDVAIVTGKMTPTAVFKWRRAHVHVPLQQGVGETKRSRANGALAIDGIASKTVNATLFLRRL